LVEASNISSSSSSSVSSSESSVIKHAVKEFFSVPFCPLLLLGPSSNTQLPGTGFLVSSFSSSFGVPLTLALDELSADESLDWHSSIPLSTFVLSSSIIPPIFTIY